MPNIFDRILSEVCLDDRIPNGTFDMSNSVHMQVLFETLTDNYQVPLNDAKTIHNKMVEGKYPERQAYNKDGLLVTFPTPQHKQKAIQRGTHFEKDPTAGPENVFGGGQPPAGGQQPPAAPQGGAPAGGEAPQQNVFPPGQEAPAKAPAGGAASALPASGAPAAEPAAPSAGTSGQAAPSALPASSAPPPTPPTEPGKPPLAVEPPPQQAGQTPQTPEQAPPPNFDVQKPPQQRAAEAAAVKQIMRGDNANQSMPPSLTEQLDLLAEFCEKERKLNEAGNLIHRIKTLGWVYFN